VYISPAVQDRKNHGQLNKDDNVRQLDYKKITTFKPRHFSSSFLQTNPNAISPPFSRNNYSLPDISDIPQDEDTVFEAEDGEASYYSPAGSNLHSTMIVTIEAHQSNGTAKLSASMQEYLNDTNRNSLQVTSNPLHSSTESDLHMGAYTNKALTDDSYEQLPSNGYVKTGTYSNQHSLGEDNTISDLTDL